MEQLNCFLCNHLQSGGFPEDVYHLQGYHGLTITRGIDSTGYACAKNNCLRSFVHFYNLPGISNLRRPLGKRIDLVLDKDSCTYIPKNATESFQYVPIIEVLKLVLSNRDVAMNNYRRMVN